MKLECISKSYGKQKVFEDFSLDIPRGQILCVLGESGCGKTTLLNILAGLTDFEGEYIDRPSGQISYIFQTPRLLPNLTVKQNLEYAGGRVETIEEFLKNAELLDCENKRPKQLSGGEKQRVSFVRAFLRPAELLLMDEPFSSLDTALKIRLIDFFARLWTENKKKFDEEHFCAAVFVTHDIEEALMLADRVVVLRKGKIIADEQINRQVFPTPYGGSQKEREKLLSVLLDK